MGSQNRTLQYRDRGDGIRVAPVRPDDVRLGPAPGPAPAPYPQIVDPSPPPGASRSGGSDAASELGGLARGGYDVFAKTIGILGVPFEKAENVAATLLQPLAQIGGTALGNMMERAAGYEPERSVAQAARAAAAQLPKNVQELGKSLTFQESAAPTMATVAREYAQGVTTHPPSAAYETGVGLAAGFLIDPFLVAAGLKGVTALGKVARIPQKLEALQPTVWKLARLEQRGGKAERIDRAVDLGQSTTGPAVKAVAEELSSRAGTPIGPRAVEQRLAQIVRGGITSEDRLAAIANPVIREFELNALELQRLGILSEHLYTHRLPAAEVAKLQTQKEVAARALRRLETAPHYVGTPEISARFPGRAAQIEKLQQRIADVNRTLYESEIYGGTGYFPRMYRTKEEAELAQQKSGWYKPSRIRAPYAKRHQDLSAEVRMEMGEIREAHYPVTKRLIQQAADIENGRLFERAAANPQLASKTPQPGFFPDPLPNSKAYGALAGMYVHPRVHGDVADLVHIRGNVERLYDSFIGAFKTNKVALSPATHFRNMMSNVMMNAFGGFSEEAQVRGLPQTLRQMKTNSEEWRRVRPYLKGSNFVTAELLDDLLRTHEAGMGTAFERILGAANAGFARVARVPSHLYQAEETVNKFNRYLWRRSQGWTQDKALLDTEKWGIDYGDLSAFEKRYMRRVMPFYTYPRKMIPLLAEGLRDNPYAVAKYPLLATLLTKHSLAQLHLTDQDYRQLQKLTPEYMQGGGYLLMPYRDANGDLRLFDWTSNVPWGPLSDLQGRGVLNTVISNPLVQIVGDIQRNKSSWNDRSIFNEKTDTRREQFAKKVLYAWQSLSPALFPDLIPGEKFSSGGVYWGRLYDALSGTPRLQGGHLKKQPLPETVAHVIGGLRTQAVDEKLALRGKALDWNEATREISAQMMQADRWYREGRVTKAERDRQLKALQDRLRDYYRREMPLAAPGQSK